MMMEATQEMCAYCFDVLVAHYEQNPEPNILFDTSLQCPMFVTLNTINRNEKRLRGCIGTLSPRPLTDLSYFAFSSAFRDKRFSPLEARELSSLAISVSLLVNYEPGQNYLDWEVERHGIIIEFDINGKSYSATYLPDVAKEQGWDQLEAVTSLIKKSGYNGSVTTALLRSIKLTRYQSSKAYLEYSEYLALRQK